MSPLPEPGALLSELVAIPSPSGDESVSAERIADYARATGLDVERVGNSILAVLDRGGPRVLFNTHHDTVPFGEGWEGDPLDPTWRGSGAERRLVARGANDAKASVAAMLTAAASHTRELRESGTLLLAITACEETSNAGMAAVLERLAERDLQPQAGVTGEPTGLEVVRAQSGLCLIESIWHGVACHAAHVTRVEHENALTKAVAELAKLPGFFRLDGAHPLLGESTLVPTVLNIGESHNQVPDRATCVFDGRIAPPHTAADCAHPGGGASPRRRDSDQERSAKARGDLRGPSAGPGGPFRHRSRPSGGLGYDVGHGASCWTPGRQVRPRRDRALAYRKRVRAGARTRRRLFGLSEAALPGHGGLVMTEHHKPIWDKGGAIDAEMLRFTIGDDWLQDRRLVEADIQGSLAHVAGLGRSDLLDEEDVTSIRGGLEALLATFRAGEWTIEPSDEDVHSAVERRLIDRIGDAGKRMHLGRSRNDQVATDLRLWVRGAIEGTHAALERLTSACNALAARRGKLPLPGYTHLRRAMPSTIADWIGGYRAAFEANRAELDVAASRISRCPLGSGAGYGIPLPLDREGVAKDLGFDGPEEPVTLTQLSRGRAELAYVSALEGIALDLGKLAFDLWLFSSKEFGFVELPEELTTGSSLMPQKRNPDLVELIRAHCRMTIADRATLLGVLRDLPAGYHRDYQLLKPPLFRTHDRMMAALPLAARLLEQLEFDEKRLRHVADDPGLGRYAQGLGEGCLG